MTVSIEPSHALFFNGITDGVIVPQMTFKNNFGELHTGSDLTHQKTPTALSAFTIEAWIIPDSGGIVWEQENVCRIIVGSPSSPGPAHAQVKLRNIANDAENTFTLSSAQAVSGLDGDVAYWDGVTFPRAGLDVHDTFNAQDDSKNDLTGLNLGHRELLQVTLTFDRTILSLHINGDVIASKTLDEEHELALHPTQLSIGGTGGEYRGTIEAVHWSRGASDAGHDLSLPVKNDSTLGLWRFEEPVEPIATSITLPSLSASTGASSSISIGTTLAQTLVDEFTGQSGLTSVDLTTSPQSNGSYSVKRFTSGSSTTVSVPHVPFNLLINPLGYNQSTGIPNREAPERVRITAVDASAGTMTVESIHLDYASNASTGRRGLLMAHGAGIGVIVTGDCLVDGGTGEPHQIAGTGTQFSHRQGQVLIDESDFENHGLLFALTMATTDNGYSKFSATTRMADNFLIGHTGRHTLNHIPGHPFMGTMPTPKAAYVEQSVDAVAQVMEASFAAQYADLSDSVPPGSPVVFNDLFGPYDVSGLTFSSVPTQAVENGMAGIDDTQRALLAIGGDGFDAEPFALRNMGDTSPTGDAHTRHMTPSTESRVAILNVPSLSTYDYAPFVQVHYNAIDFAGTGMKHAATGRLTHNYSSNVIKFQSTEAFGKTGTTIRADYISIAGEVAGASSITATLDHNAKTLTFSSAPTTAFQNAALADAIVNVSLRGSVLLVEKTIPSGNTQLASGVKMVDLIHSDISAGTAVLYAPGGVLEFESDSSFYIEDGGLVGDDSEGTIAETQLDVSLTPDNYLPLHSSDSVQKTPQVIASALYDNTVHKSFFHKLVISASINEQITPNLEASGNFQAEFKKDMRPRTGVFVNNGGGYSASATSITVDGVDATTKFGVGLNVYTQKGLLLGAITSISSTAIGISAGIAGTVADNEELFHQPLMQAVSSTNQSTAVNEVFDIIGHRTKSGRTRVVVQPSDRRRFSQLTKMLTNKDDPEPNTVIVQYVVGRGKVIDFDSNGESDTVLRAHGLVADALSNSVNVKGDGAPDSHIVKEIMPGSPVVTMTMGGVGQGAVNTKPTWDPSPTARVGWSTRRDCTTKVSALGSTTITVVPLNNNATDLASWGTYCFPKIGRIFLQKPGIEGADNQLFASAEYASKTGSVFTFASGTTHLGSGKFVLFDGTEAASFADWKTETAIAIGGYLQVDDKFNAESIAPDGTTINDRLFQTLDTVQHDYQLGTQYASTRAMIEFPLFEDFFFDDPDAGVFPGPDNSMKLHLDATYTAPTWAPNPVGRRPKSVAPEDPQVNSAFSLPVSQKKHKRGTTISAEYDSANRRIYVKDASLFPIPSAAPVVIGGIGGALRFRSAFTKNGEWVIYSAIDTTNNYLTVAGNAAADDAWAFSSNFLRDYQVGSRISPAQGIQNMNYASIADNPTLSSAGFEQRSEFYYDRANVMTQGGNIDYGLKQYVSAVEFRSGPTTNPHLPHVQNKRARGIVEAFSSPNLTLESSETWPATTSHSTHAYRVRYYDNTASAYKYAHYKTRTGNVLSLISIDSGFNPSAGTEILLVDFRATGSTVPTTLDTQLLNSKWANPFCPGGLRDGDTVWMNMQYTNPHSVEGLFCKSRGTLNEGQVWAGFLGGEGDFATTPRESIPMENFLIGNSCLETSRNFVQHINKTIELNYEALGLSATLAPTVAYLDPYQCTEDYARVLLYDVAHDREFIAFQDLWMQVQSSPATAKVKTPVDVANGFPSQHKGTASTAKSEFMEAAMAHNNSGQLNVTIATHTTGYHNHIPDVTATMRRTNDAVTEYGAPEDTHLQIDSSSDEVSTLFDTPDGTRVVPAFLSMKGIRSSTLDLSGHEESRLQHLPHWNQMDFVRRLTLDFGEIGVRQGITDIEAAAREVVRRINQAGAKTGRTHARRPADQFLGEADRFDFGKGHSATSTNPRKDPTAPHQKADFAATGSTHDPAPFWNADTAFGSHDRGTHMGYMRAHLGRVVNSAEGKKGYSIVVHSTVPGASGRNFCAWMDNSNGQAPYRPEYLIGHGGRFRNYWCQPDEMDGENMHPAPMPINKFGRPFAPITTLREYIPMEEVDADYQNTLDFGPEIHGSGAINAHSTDEHATGRSSNTILNSSFEPKSDGKVLVEGLRVGTQAKARINFGGLTQAGIPGWAPDAGKWGMGRDGVSTRYDYIYGDKDLAAGTKQHGLVNQSGGGYIPDDDIRPDKMGTGQLYGIRMVDHRGDSHTIRMAYKQYGEALGNSLTRLPPTLDNEVIIHFDDRDVGQGGFTIGKHISGKGDVCGQYTGGTKQSFRGNLWNTYNSPAVGISATFQKDGSNDNFKIVLAAPYGTGSNLAHTDILGYLGLPDSGLIQLNDVAGTANNGETYYYTSRSHYAKAGASGVHYLYGVKNISSDYSSAVTRIFSPRINFTSLLTDEVIAAAVNHAINMEDPNTEDVSATSFDCTSYLAPDGKTLGEWGVAPDAIRIKAHSSKHKVTPLRHLFQSSVGKDWGIQAAASNLATGTNHLGGLTEAEILAGVRLDVGYIPATVLHITTKYRGPNANTATPVLVDSLNDSVNVKQWRDNLRGDTYIRLPGDRITPCINTVMVNIASKDTSTTPDHLVLPSNEYLYLAMTPASDDSNAWSEEVVFWRGDTDWARAVSKAGAAENKLDLLNHSADFVTNLAADDVLVAHANLLKFHDCDGIRTTGSHHGEPFLYFRGGRSSVDRWVPLYFGGGFSGVTLDINDGTQNDYEEFYTHPYSSGPTGSAGMQNVGEAAGSYALIDTNAMLAMFPGTPYLNQHNGQHYPPFFNKDAMLSPDLDGGNNTNASSTGVTYAGGGKTVNCNRPSPIVLRFSHPHARYSATSAQNDATTYLVFGPGQAVPHNFQSYEPQLSDIITTGNGYSAVPSTHPAGESFLPNLISHGGSTLYGFSANLPPTKEYQASNISGYNWILNWEPTKGMPNSRFYGQAAGKGRYYDTHFGPSSPVAYAHPFDDVFKNYAGTFIGAIANTRASNSLWHMDGGYHPGGHFLDNHIIRNVKNPSSTNRLATGSGDTRNPSVFRVSSALAKAYSNADIDGNIFVIDATRCQNAEELAAVLAAGINTFPGIDPLKAIGGTFLPTMQHAGKQDRYGWVALDVQPDGYTAEDGAAATLQAAGTLPTTLPAYGWLRISNGTKSAFAPYVSYTGATFTLGKNGITNSTNLVDPTTKAAIAAAQVNGDNGPAVVYVWTKAGTHQYNNTTQSREHMTQVHFNGFMDAVDRTKPIGAVGWAGEAYSYLNSYNGTSIGGTKFPAGLGAWHPFLGFAPYGSAETCLASSPPIGITDTPSSLANDFCVHGLSSRHLVAVSHESELPLIAKTDRDGIIASGDWLSVKADGNILRAGTQAWSTNKVHNKSRYNAPATAGPHVEANIRASSDFTDYPNIDEVAYPNARVTSASHVSRADPCQSPTGDLFWDKSIMPTNQLHTLADTLVQECVGITSRTEYYGTSAGLYKYYDTKSAARNFTEEHIVWKRMDGGNLTMPASNARGLGMIPWTVRKDGGSYKTVGEKILGNCRFSFESTNSAMFPIIQAQELSHPQLAQKHINEKENALIIPNEHLQFESMQVVDDTGQEHRLEGGSPLGTVIMDFRHVSDRDIEGLSPAIAGSGISPNMKIRLPNADEIPGNIIVRPGFDRIQAYQNETMGSGGLMHPAQAQPSITDTFKETYDGPRLWPTWENNGWEHLSQDGTDLSDDRLAFPASSSKGWESHTDNAPLNTAYEPHDRSLQFHVTRVGVTMTHRYDVDELTYSGYSGTEITVGSTPEDDTWKNSGELSGGRWFLRVYDPTTNKGVLASYENTGTNKFTDVVYSPDFVSFVTGKTGLKVVPSYFMPAGSTRFFASRRLRDHSEYSGASPDMKTIDWTAVNGTPLTALSAPKMTPMPIPRMGHHYVTPTMALMPGHYAHPAYQRLYNLGEASRITTSSTFEEDMSAEYSGDDLLQRLNPRDPLVWFSGASAPYGPSDIHGGAFTLLTETKVKFDGYGIAASKGSAGTTNSQGGHSIVLEAAGTYTLNDHFPDPMEVGAYQIIIQPNVFKQQFSGYHSNHSDAVKAPSESGTKVTELTGQQVNTVVAIAHDDGSNTNGAYTLILAEATMADVRGCEIMLNEIMLDLEPDASSQFTNLPPLANYNALGVEETTSPAFSRRTLPYHPNMFIQTTPGFTLTVPWWAQLHKDGATASAATHFRHLEWHTPDHYYQMNRATFGAVGAQITLAGYPTCYPDIYAEHYRVRSLNPNAKVTASSAGGSTVNVDNAELFPVKAYYGEVLEYTDANGERQTATYTNRTGTLAHATLGTPTQFQGVTEVTPLFFDNLTNGTIIRLSGPYDNRKADEIFTNSLVSMTTRVMPQTMNGTRDTNSLHLADAYLCMWHPNLGRPFTYYSDDNSRGFYDKNGATDTPVLKKGLNNVPEHFETIHYNDFFYAASKGPFAFGMRWIIPPGAAGTGGTGTTQSGADMDSDGNLSHQGGTIGSDKYNFAGYWPGGSRGGAGSSRLDGFLETLIGWGGKLFGVDCVSFHDNTGLEERTYAQMTTASDNARNTCFGYRFALRQPYNRPRWSPYVRGYLEVANANALLGYYHGPFVQQDNKDDGWTGGTDYPATYTGVLERLTQISALLNQDQLGRQVRYSDGRRMTRAFGCPVRTIRNSSSVRRMYAGDRAGLEISEIAQAHRYYMIDWWGNTRGEDVRRFPVRGFGISPAWDPEDAYEDGGSGNRPEANGLFATSTDRQSGNSNTANNDVAAMAIVDWFNPTNAMRVGDRGDGRGVRWPTHFNESLLMDVSESVEPTGLVLSQPTAEPTVGKGLVRPRNDVLQAGETDRGISARLDLADDDGLLKPTAMVNETTESITTDTMLAEPVGGDGVRIGLDVDTLGELNDGVSREYVVMSTEAHSLHSNRDVGQRTTLRGAMNVGNRTLGHLDMTALDWAGQPVKGIIKVSDAHSFWALGGTYVMNWKRRAGALDVTGWGQQLPSGMCLWLKADSLELNDGDAVATWADASGNNRNFTQSTSSKKPTYIASESDFNNMPVLRFDGGDKLELAFDANLNTNEFTIFFVGAVNNDNNANQLGYESRSSSPVTRSGYNLYADMTGSNNQWEFWAGADSTWKALKSATGSITLNTPDIITMQISGGDGAGASATQLLRVDGTQIGTQSANFYKSTADAQNIGTLNTSSAPYVGEIAEIIQFNRALTATEMRQVEGYLANKYGLVVEQSAWNPSNPYQDDNHDSMSDNMNNADSEIEFLVRPAFALDKSHVQLFRSNMAVKSGAPQAGGTFYGATAGGKYGIYTSDAASARTGTPSSPPYAPVYSVDPVSNTVVSHGPKILGVDVSGYDKTDITQPVARITMSENTLEHFRSDAARKEDYSVEPRHSQTLHPKGSKGDTSFNSGDHSTE